MSDEMKHSATCGFGKPGSSPANPLGACTCGAFESSREYDQMQEQKKAMLAKEQQSIRADERKRIVGEIKKLGVSQFHFLPVIRRDEVLAIFGKEGRDDE
jgi:hypothetical protein